MLIFFILHDFQFIETDKRQSIDSHRLILEKHFHSQVDHNMR